MEIETGSSDGDDESSISLISAPFVALEPMHFDSAASSAASPQSESIDSQLPIAQSLRKISSFRSTGSAASVESGNSTDMSHDPQARALFFQIAGVKLTDGGRSALDEWEGEWDVTAPRGSQRQSFDRETVLLTHNYFGDQVWDAMDRVDHQRALAKCAEAPESFLNQECQKRVAAASHAQAVYAMADMPGEAPLSTRARARLSLERHASWTDRARRNSNAAVGKTPLSVARASIGEGWAGMSAQKKRKILEFASRIDSEDAGAAEGGSGDGAAEIMNPAHRARRAEPQRTRGSAKQGQRRFAPMPPPTPNALAGESNARRRIEWPFKSGMGPVFYALLLASAMVPSWIGWLGEWTNLGEHKASVGDVANRYGILGAFSVISAFLCAPSERLSTGLIGSTVVFWGWTVSYPLMALLFTLARQEWFAAAAFAFQLFFTHPVLYLGLSGIAHRIGTPIKHKVATKAEQRRVAIDAARPAAELGPLWRATHAGADESTGATTVGSEQAPALTNADDSEASPSVGVHEVSGGAQMIAI